MKIELTAFIKELINRLGAKSPKFFVIISKIAILCGLITGLPGLLVQFGITLPPDMLLLQNKVVAWAAVIAALISKLTVANATTLINETRALPFTEDNQIPKVVSIKSVTKKRRKKVA